MTNYNDLVFMFRVEEMLNDYLLKGIHTITASYNDYLVVNGHEGIDEKEIEMKISTIIPIKEDKGSMQKSLVLRAEKRTS